MSHSYMQEQADPFAVDYNTDELLSGGTKLTEAAENLSFVVTDVTRESNNNKVSMKVSVQVIDGEHEGKTHNEYFAGSEAARWRVREFLIACGHYHLEEREGKEVKAVNKDAHIMHCNGCLFKADAIRRAQTNGNIYTSLKNFKPEV